MAFDLLHSSKGSSELSPQSSSMSHFQLWGMQRPLRHLNCPGRQVLAAHCAGSSSDWSLQSASPSHCHASGMQRLLAHCHWWASHWCVAEGGRDREETRQISFVSKKRKFLNFENKLKLDIYFLKNQLFKSVNQPQRTGSSSEPSWQSRLLSHSCWELVQFPSLH